MDGTSPETAAARVVTDRRVTVGFRDLRASGAILVFSMGGMSRQRQEGPGEEGIPARDVDRRPQKVDRKVGGNLIFSINLPREILVPMNSIRGFKNNN